MLVDGISNSGLSTVSNAIDESNFDGNGEQTGKEITSEMEAIAAAYHIFRNVALPGSKYIDELDLRRFMGNEEVDLVFPLIDVAETGKIDRKGLTEWVVKVYNCRKTLAHALNDTKSAVKQLNKLVMAVLISVITIVWLLLVEIATTKMIVEEMNIFTTIFLRYDNEKIYYPNSLLATKAVSNFYRSLDMGDSLEFSIDFMTPVERIGALKERVKKYLERTPQYWHPNHSMVVKEIENVNNIKMGFYFGHTMNFQEFGKKTRRRSELVVEVKKIFDEINIRYNLLPQEIHLVKSDETR